MEENQKEKKKISLATYVITLLIILAIIALLVYAMIRDDKEETGNTSNILNPNNIIGTNESNKETTNYIVLYNGEEIKQTVGKQVLSYSMKNTSENKKKYNIKYYNYEKEGYKGEKTGIFGKEETYEGYSFVSNVEKIAISKKYDAMPRKTEKIKEIPDKLKEFDDYSNIDIEAIDLDGDGKKENIICVQKQTSKEDYDVDENEAYSEIILFDSNFEKVATLAQWTNKGVDKFNKDVFLQLDDVIYVDIDNDGIMEILVDLPAYESSILSVLKYNNNKIQGDINIKVDMTP